MSKYETGKKMWTINKEKKVKRTVGNVTKFIITKETNENSRTEKCSE